MVSIVSAAGSGRNSYRALSWLFIAIASIIPFVYSTKVWHFATAPKEAVIQIGIMVVMSIWMFTGRDRRIYFPAVFIPVMIFMSYCAVTMAWAINPYESVITVLQWTISAIAILIVANIINKDHLLRALLFSAVLVSIAGIIHLTISPDAWREIPSIMFANAHQASFYVLMCLSIAFYFSGWYLLGVIPIGTFLVLENSETVIVALCVMGICTLIYYVRFQSPQVLIMGCVFVFMALVMVAPSTKTDTLSEKDTSINIDQFKIGSRKALYQRALSMVRDFPQGIGINNLKIHYPLYLKGEKRWETTPKTQTTYVHNDYLQLLIEAGIAGFLLFVLAVFAGICSLDWKNRRTPFVFVSILSLWVISSAQFSMYQAWAPFLLFCFLGVGQCEE